MRHTIKVTFSLFLLLLAILIAMPVTGNRLTIQGAYPVILPLICRPEISTYLTTVKEAFRAATEYIHIAIMSGHYYGCVDRDQLWHQLIAAAGRGVEVKVLFDQSDWAPQIREQNKAAFLFLLAHGIQARFDNAAITTQAKLVIIDGKIVILGSSDWTNRAFYYQEQANIIVNCKLVAGAFAAYFIRLWEDKLEEETIHLDLTLLPETGPAVIPLFDTNSTQMYSDVLLHLLNLARYSVFVVMHRIAYYPHFPDSLSNRILTALVDAAQRGLTVKIIIDDNAPSATWAEHSKATALYLLMRGVRVRFDDPALVTHANLVIIDREDILLGSTNWHFHSLKRNNEVNIAILQSPQVAALYEQFFWSLWRNGISLGD
ncbi:phospholipase D-like domain-containing protein [Candidatus Acetothermia bacterium]|nr:phospholipase D-like domain-containing protein [Candidatus Acetothermia bacterium]